EVLAILRDEVQRIVAVSEQEILQAIGVYYDTTHNVAEGAAAAALAALLKDAKGDAREGVQNGVSGLMLTGGNINRALFRQAIGG
ncbi:MAG: threonine dehydratase, partial [Pseudomonadales bacterium]